MADNLEVICDEYEADSGDKKLILTEKKFRKTVITLGVIIFLLLVATVGVFILLNSMRSPLQEKYCVNDICLREAAYLKSLLNEEVNPCEDFYSFVCQKWSDKHLSHAWDDQFSGVEKIRETVLLMLTKFLEGANLLDDPLPLKQSRDFFRACNNKDLANVDYTSLYKYLNQSKLPETPTFFSTPEEEWYPPKFDLASMLVGMKKTFGTELFFDVSVIEDIYNTTRNVVFLSPGGRSSSLLPQISDLKKWKDEKEFKHFAKKIINNVIMVKLNNSSIQKGVDILWRLHSTFLKTFSIEPDNEAFEFRKISVNKLQQTTDSFMTEQPNKLKGFWFKYVTLLFEDVANISNRRTYIHYYDDDLELIHSTLITLSKSNDVHIELYAWFVSVFAMLPSVNTKLLNDIPEKYKIHSSQNCVDLTVKFMNHAVGYGFVDQKFFHEAKADINNMISNLKAVFIDRVVGLSWLDEKTKHEIVTKVEKMATLIGVQDWTFNRTIIENYYSGIAISLNNFLDNMMSIIKKSIKEKLSNIGHQHEYQWEIFSDVSAYHHRTKNSINIPMAFLSFPFYRLGIETINYGSIGTVLGHEMMHGFDTAGIYFDGSGNFRQWSTKRFEKRFDKRLQCFVDQYSNYKYFGEHINGEQTLDENLADNAGLTMAYKAHQKYLKTVGKPKHLPGFEKYTSDQLFFIGYATSMCEKQPKTKKIDASRTTSPNPIRILAVLQNSDEFSEAFSCAKGTMMNPNRVRCELW